jgi:peptidyl-prolyl cis-trans isomerase C
MHFMVLGMLIDDLLMEQFLRKNGPRIEEAEINKRMADLELEAKKKGKTVQDFYKEWNQTEKQVRNSLVKMLQWDAYVKDRINEADLKRFYGDTKDFFDEVTVHVHHILLRVPFNAPEADRQATRQKLLAIRQEIVSGQISFADAAKKYSQCPSAKDGGNIGFIPRKLSPVEESFAKAAFALQAGQVSDVVATDFGLHLIKVTERKPGKKLSEFDKVKELVRDLYVEEMYQSLLAQLRQAAKVEMP